MSDEPELVQLLTPEGERVDDDTYGGFVADLTVKDNVYLTAGLHGMTKAEIDAAFDEIIAFAGIEDFVGTPYKHLSSGMKVRIAFSVVSRLDEPILLVYEVLAVAIEAGATVGEAFHTLSQRWGTVVPLGEYPGVGIGGHVAGGAFGFLCRQLGLAADYLYAVEVDFAEDLERANLFV